MLDFSPANHPTLLLGPLHAALVEEPPANDGVDDFVDALFRYADEDNRVSLRAFFDGGGGVFRIVDCDLRAVGLDGLCSAVRKLNDEAKAATRPVVVCPPIATFAPAAEPGAKAREQDLAEGLALSVECDAHPAAARTRLSELLGPPTVVVESGGVTSNGELKCHLHWRLNEPTRSRSDHELLKKARQLACALVGGDASNVPIVHPIRWPGSPHRKAADREARIAEINPQREIDLRETIEALEAVSASSQKPREARLAVAERGEGEPTCEADGDLVAAIVSGASYHEPLVRLAARLVGSGMFAGAAVNHLREIMQAVPSDQRDERWQNRFDDIQRTVKSAEEKFADASAADPVDIFARYNPPELRRGLLPPVIEELAFTRGELMGADPGGIAMAALTVCAASIPDRYKVKVKRHDAKWFESARLWTGLVGLPSTKKSPVLTPVVAPLRAIDDRLSATYAQQMKSWQATVSKTQPEGLHARPVQIRKIVEDVTKEALENILKDSSDGVLAVHDELAGFFGGMEKYNGGKGAMADRAFFLQAFNGGSKSVDRISRGHVHIPNLSINLIGGIQPAAIRNVISAAQDDGLIQRLIPIVLAPGREDQDVPMPDVDTPYSDLISRLVSFSLGPLPSGGGGMDFEPNKEVTLTFSEGAQEVRNELSTRHHHLAAVEGLDIKFAAHIGKYDGIFARLCLTWHFIQHAGDDHFPMAIAKETAEGASRFLHQFLLPHAAAFYFGVLGLSDQHDQLEAVCGYILTHSKETMTPRDVARGDRAMRAMQHSDAYKVLEKLESLGWLEPQRVGRDQATKSWRVNPAVHRKFAQKAKEEALRRQEARAAIIEITGSR